MLYTVGEIARKLNIPASTLRYYDKEGLLPFVERSQSGVRMFHDEDIQGINIIGCLKKSGMKLSDIRKFMELVMSGDETIGERLEMIKKQREQVLSQIETLNETLNVLKYKQWYYETAEKYGNTKKVESLSENEMPEELREIYRKIKSE